MKFKKYLIESSNKKVVWSNDGWWGKGFLIKTNSKYAWIKDLDNEIIKISKNQVADGWVDTFEELSYHMKHNKIK